MLYNMGCCSFETEDNKTMTVGELIAILENYSPDTPICIGAEGYEARENLQVTQRSDGNVLISDDCGIYFEEA